MGVKYFALGLLITAFLIACGVVIAHADSPIAQVIPVNVTPALSVPTPLANPVTIYSLDATTTQLFYMTNAARVAVGDQPLQENQQLMEGSYYRAEYFCTHTVEHFSPDGTTPWDFFNLAGYDYKDAGENIGLGYDSAAEMQLAFIASPEHYSNIIKPSYTDIGMADMCNHVVIEFGDK